MTSIAVNLKKPVGKFKPEHCVNNGPKPVAKDQSNGNMPLYKAAHIPYARNHDASHWSGYGGSHVVDVNCIFTDFSRDVDDPTAYDFVLTDVLMENLEEAGTKCFYRLGAAIEHWKKKYNTIMPADFLKWAQICEHIIRHYTEGWADGFTYDMEYWEIWNEPDLDEDDSPNKKNWSGTWADYHRFYNVTSRYLKSKFPHLKIGGPALSYRYGEWVENFLTAITKDGNAPLDFFSCHRYGTDPHDFAVKTDELRAQLDRFGYKSAEIVLNEWNYVKGWGAGEFPYSIRTIISMKGAAFALACMTVAQHGQIDMLMYYDARPCVFNGMFNFYDYSPLKTYYDFLIFSELYRFYTPVELTCNDRDVYVLAGIDRDGKPMVSICYYTDDDNAADKEIALGGLCGTLGLYRLDEEHDYTKDGDWSGETLVMKPNTVVVLK